MPNSDQNDKLHPLQNKEVSKDAEEFLKSQLDEAWSQYRHCEQMRTQYLNFFFATFLATAGFIVTLFKTDGSRPVPVDSYFGAAALTLVLFLFSSLLFITFVRLGYVLAYYIKVMRDTRNYFLGTVSPAAKIWNFTGVVPDAINSGIFRVQRSAASIVILFCTGLVGFEGFLTKALVSRVSWGDARSRIVFVCSVGMTIILIILLVKGEQANVEEARQSE